MVYRTQSEISDNRISNMSHRKRRRWRVVLFLHSMITTRNNRAHSAVFSVQDRAGFWTKMVYLIKGYNIFEGSGFMHTNPS